MTRAEKIAIIQSKLSSFSPDQLASLNKKIESINQSDTLQDTKTGVETGATLGARPFVAGLGGAAGGFIGSLEAGDSFGKAIKTGKESFSQARMEAQQQQEKAAERSPKAYTAANIISSLPALALIPGTSFQAAARMGAASGVGEALGQSEDLKQGIEMTAGGVAAGLAGEGLVRGGAKAIKAITPTARKFANNRAFGALGGFKRQVTQAVEKEGKDAGASELGEAALKNNLIPVFGSPSRIAKKAEAFTEKTGKGIGKLHEEGQAILDDPFVKQGLTKKGQDLVKSTELNAEKWSSSLLKSFRRDLKGKAGSSQAIGRLETELETLAQNKVVSLSKAKEIRTQIDSLIEHGKKTQDLPLVQQKLMDMRNFISDKIADRVSTVDKLKGNKGKGLTNLKRMNKDFHQGSKISEIARDRSNSIRANQLLGLGGTMVGGGVAGGLSGQDLAGSLGTGLAVAGTYKAGQLFGPAMIARASNAVAKALEASAPLRKLVQQNPEVRQSLINKFLEQSPEEKQDSAMQRRMKKAQ